MADLSTHYKEITPEQTVQNIKDFFEQHNFILKLSDLNEAESGTWYCHVDLYTQNGIRLGGTNGKGMTREYALASGYAELYERFCNKIFFFSNDMWTRAFMEENKKLTGHYFSPDEKMLSYNEELTGSIRVKHYFDYLTNNRTNLLKETISYLTNDIYVGVPMYNIGDKNDVIYMDPRLLLRVERSNGMAAGNTLDEALVQALSEVAEREASSKFFKEMSCMSFKALNLDKLENENLVKIINKIKDSGYDFYLFDLSYNYQLPVIMSLLIDRKIGIVNVNFGSFPVFDIAAERVLTELYQGIQTYHSADFKMRIQIPYRTIPLERIYSLYSNSISGQVFSATFFDNIEFVDSYNKEVFADKTENNGDFYQYYVELGKKLGGIKFYYMNVSLSDKIYAVHVMLENNETYTPMTICDDFAVNLNEITESQAIRYLHMLKDIYNNIYEGNPVNIRDLREITDLLTNNLMIDMNILAFLNNCILWNEFLSVSRGNNNFFPLFVFFDPLMNETDQVAECVVDSEIYSEYKKYLYLLVYLKTGLYTPQELLHMFNDIFNFNITEEDINKSLLPSYLLQKAYIQPMNKYFHSDEFYNLIHTYMSL